MIVSCICRLHVICCYDDQLVIAVITCYSHFAAVLFCCCTPNCYSIVVYIVQCLRFTCYLGRYVNLYVEGKGLGGGLGALPPEVHDLFYENVLFCHGF